MDWSLFDRWDALAILSALLLLVGAYVVFPHPVFQYAVWLTVFTIWMAWFVYFGTKYYYGVFVEQG